MGLPNSSSAGPSRAAGQSGPGDALSGNWAPTAAFTLCSPPRRLRARAHPQGLAVLLALNARTLPRRPRHHYLSLGSGGGPGGPGQQWRRGHRRLRGGLSQSPAAEGPVIPPLPFLGNHKVSRPGAASSSPVLRSPGRPPPLLGFAATSPRRHCACARGERCAPAEPIRSCVRLFSAPA